MNNIKIPFDITLAKEIVNGTKEGRIVTRGGLPVKILCFDRKDPVYPIIALLPCKRDGIDVEVNYSFTTDGETIVCDINENDLMLEIPETIEHIGKQVHCKFCEGEKKKVWKQIGFTKKGGQKYGYAEIVEHSSFSETCDLRIYGDKLCIDYNAYSTDSSFNDEIKINFCPICGRKLPDKNE